MNTLDKLQKQREENEGRIKLRDAILRLTDNADFRLVFRDEYFVQACARFVRESISPQLNAEEQANALAFAQSAGYCKQWLNMQIKMGDTAEGEMAGIAQMEDDVRAEGEDED